MVVRMGSQSFPFVVERSTSANTIKEVVFRIFCQTRPGQEVRIVGSVDRLGCWDASRGFRLSTSSDEYPYWRSIPTLFVTPVKSSHVEFKIVIANSNGEVEWEDTTNRVYDLAHGQCDTVLLHATFGVAGIREIPQRLRPDKTSLVRRQSESLLCRHNSISSTSFALLRNSEQDSSGVQRHRDSRTFDARTCQSGHWGNVGATGRQLTRSESSDQLMCSPENASVMLVMNSAANWIDVVGNFTNPPWKVNVPMYQDPTNPRNFWLELDKEFPDLKPGSYEFKFLVDSSRWEYSPFFPTTHGGTSLNNILHIDYRLVERIKRFQAQPAGPKNSIISTISDAPKPSPPRSVSTAERLFDTGYHSPSRLPPPRSSEDIQNLRRHNSATTLWQEPMTPGLYTGDVPLLAADLPAVHSSKGLRFKVGAHMIPKDSSGGEDAYSFDSGRCIGVADGVGSMQFVLGHSSKQFAQDLCDFITDASKSVLADDHEGKTCGEVPPSTQAKEVMALAFDRVKSHGAATAVACILDADTRRLGISWIGDSGVMVVRRPTKQRSVGEEPGAAVSRSRVSMVYKTREQQHSFNFPYQLSHFPESLHEQVLQKPNSPEDCNTADIELQEGDLVLVYTDGVCDNLFEHEILEICNRALSPYSAKLIANPGAATSASVVAESLVTAAFHRSRDTNARTPFGRHAKMNGFPTWERGGKEDDITLVAGWVVSESAPSSHLDNK